MAVSVCCVGLWSTGRDSAPQFIGILTTSREKRLVTLHCSALLAVTTAICSVSWQPAHGVLGRFMLWSKLQGATPPSRRRVTCFIVTTTSLSPVDMTTLSCSVLAQPHPELQPQLNLRFFPRLATVPRLSSVMLVDCETSSSPPDPKHLKFHGLKWFDPTGPDNYDKHASFNELSSLTLCSL